MGFFNIVNLYKKNNTFYVLSYVWYQERMPEIKNPRDSVDVSISGASIGKYWIKVSRHDPQWWQRDVKRKKKSIQNKKRKR